MNIDNLAKVTVEIQFNDKTAGLAPGRNSNVRFDFIFGVASSGLSTFEREIYNKSAGDTLSISVPRTSAPEYFGHLYQHIYHQVKSGIIPDVFNLEVSISAVGKSEEREVVKAMTDDDALAALAADGRLIKRPFVALPSGDFLVGFKPVDWNQALLG